MSRNQDASVSVYIGLGSNLDNPMRRIVGAFELLDALPQTRLVSRSSLYRSAPLGPVEQPDFVNAVAELTTALDAGTLLQRMQALESEQGRDHAAVRWGPRVLDLDLLVYGSKRIDDAVLQVPHPGIAVRNFVLLPLREIAPDLVIPGLGPVSKLLIDEDEPRISRIDPRDEDNCQSVN